MRTEGRADQAKGDLKQAGKKVKDAFGKDRPSCNAGAPSDCGALFRCPKGCGSSGSDTTGGTTPRFMGLITLADTPQ